MPVAGYNTTRDERARDMHVPSPRVVMPVFSRGDIAENTRRNLARREFTCFLKQGKEEEAGLPFFRHNFGNRRASRAGITMNKLRGSSRIPVAPRPDSFLRLFSASFSSTPPKPNPAPPPLLSPSGGLVSNIISPCGANSARNEIYEGGRGKYWRVGGR